MLIILIFTLILRKLKQLISSMQLGVVIHTMRHRLIVCKHSSGVVWCWQQECGQQKPDWSSEFDVKPLPSFLWGWGSALLPHRGQGSQNRKGALRAPCVGMCLSILSESVFTRHTHLLFFSQHLCPTSGTPNPRLSAVLIPLTADIITETAHCLINNQLPKWLLACLNCSKEKQNRLPQESRSSYSFFL